MFQGFGMRVYDEVFFAQPLLPKDLLEKRMKEEQNSFVWGQTCDGVDWIHRDCPFPVMNKNEWLMYRNIGAYNKALECSFNGFELP